jgi:hypothetical protein
VIFLLAFSYTFNILPDLYSSGNVKSAVMWKLIVLYPAIDVILALLVLVVVL